MSSSSSASAAPSTRAVISKALKDRATLANVRGGPRQIKSTATHLYYVDGREGNLFRCSVDALEPFNPQRVDIELPSSKEPMSKEEEALRERLRNDLKGISNYTVARSASGTELLFITCGTRHLLAAPDGTGVRDVNGELAKTNPMLKLSGAWMDVKHCSTDILTFTFVHHNNLFWARLNENGLGGVVRPITTCGTYRRSCAVADYIMQEEFSQYSGNWWAPQQQQQQQQQQQGAASSSSAEMTKDSRVLFTVTDVSRQREVPIFDKSLEVEQIPFPRVGDPNAVTSLVVADMSEGPNAAIAFRMLPFGAITSRFPWAEYIVRMGWRDRDTVWLQVLSRDQERSVLLQVAVASLVDVEGESVFFSASADAAACESVASRFTILRERNIPWAWVEVTDDIAVQADGRTVVACHNVTESTAKPNSGERGWFQVMEQAAPGEPWNARPMGDVDVVYNSTSVQSDGDVYFMGHWTTRGQSLGRIGSQEGAEAEKLSPDGAYVSSFHVLPGKRGVAYVASTLDTPPYLAFAPACAGAPSPSTANVTTASPINVSDLAQVHFGSAENCRGQQMHYRLRVPQGVPPAGGWPLMMYVYGGPHVQLVRENFAGRCEVVQEVLVSKGVAVATVDNQMNHALGLVAHSVCKLAMGRFETDDYVTVAKHLTTASNVPGNAQLDAARVGIFGWSYGGYATLLAMSQAANVFKLGLAGAPVGDWRLYDTGYTERYMGLVPQQDKAYDDGAIPAYAEGFPEEPNRLFLAHGTTDENVHLTNTTRVIEALVQHNKPYSLLLYPGERHSLRQNPQSRHHYDVSLVHTVLMHL